MIDSPHNSPYRYPYPPFFTTVIAVVVGLIVYDLCKLVFGILVVVFAGSLTS